MTPIYQVISFYPDDAIDEKGHSCRGLLDPNTKFQIQGGPQGGAFRGFVAAVEDHHQNIHPLTPGRYLCQHSGVQSTALLFEIDAAGSFVAGVKPIMSNATRWPPR